MREIKFRGKSVNGEWYYGYLHILPQKIQHIEQGSYISNKAGMPFAYQVRPETVGQYTGLHDKNGKEIYAGDIMRGYNAYGEAFEKLTVIEWDEKEACWIGSDWSDLNGEEVIGNIYENPELIKEESA